MSSIHSASITKALLYTKPNGRAPSGERVMTNIEGTLGLDESACVCSYECASDAQSESHGLN